MQLVANTLTAKEIWALLVQCSDIFFRKSSTKSKVIGKRVRDPSFQTSAKMTTMPLQARPQGITFDEYGRPFIILKEQDKQRRLTGLDAQKVNPGTSTDFNTDHHFDRLVSFFHSLIFWQLKLWLIFFGPLLGLKVSLSSIKHLYSTCEKIRRRQCAPFPPQLKGSNHLTELYKNELLQAFFPACAGVIFVVLHPSCCKAL